MKVKMVGTCARCGKKHVRNLPLTVAFCRCGDWENVASKVTLVPTVCMDKWEYAKFFNISKFSGVPVEPLVNEFLSEFARQKLASLPCMTWR